MADVLPLVGSSWARSALTPQRFSQPRAASLWESRVARGRNENSTSEERSRDISASVARIRSSWILPVTGVSIEKSMTSSPSPIRCQGVRVSAAAARTKVPRPTIPAMAPSRWSSS